MIKWCWQSWLMKSWWWCYLCDATYSKWWLMMSNDCSNDYYCWYHSYVGLTLTSYYTYYPISSGGFRDYGAEIICRALVWKFFVNQDYSSSSYSLKLLCLKGVLKCFPVISFQFFIRCGAPSGLPKVWGLGPWRHWSP